MDNPEADVFSDDSGVTEHSGMDLEDDESELELDVTQQVPSLESANVSDAPAAASANTEEFDPNDEFKPSGTIWFTIDDFEKFLNSPGGTSRFSEPIRLRGVDWKVMARCSRREGYMGFFIQCVPDPTESFWSCLAHASLSVVSHDDGEPDIERPINHLFSHKENDWGFAKFVKLEELLDHFIRNNALTLKATVTAEAPHGVFWDSKTRTGYNGLMNQGATCYMNSVLQTLFFIGKLRKRMYRMPTVHEDAIENVSLEMQRVFYDLQTGIEPVSTCKLTASFGWSTNDSFQQHDAQELFRVLLENLEMKMAGTPAQGLIPELLSGKMKSFVKCLSVDYESAREEPFYDLQLNIRGNKNVLSALREYVASEALNGANMYDAGEHGLQNAVKGIQFLHFPPVLHLHLMRFQYDMVRDTNSKINSRFEFPDELDLNEFIEGNKEVDFTYKLHAVLVHSGEFGGGHYVAYINTALGESESCTKWYKFDDDVVSRVSVDEATTTKFGGNTVDANTCAYMLVYVRKTAIEDVLCPVTDEDVPIELRRRFDGEREEAIRKHNEELEAQRYIKISLLTEDLLVRHRGYDVFNQDACENEFGAERIERTTSPQDLYRWVAKRIGMEYDEKSFSKFRLWILTASKIGFWHALYHFNAALISPNGSNRLFDLLRGTQVFVFVEIPRIAPCLFSLKSDILVFLKYFDVSAQQMMVVGSIVIDISRPLLHYDKAIQEIAKLPSDVVLNHYVELAPNCIAPLSPEHSFQELCRNLYSGLIVIVEDAKKSASGINVKKFLDDKFNRIYVEFVSQDIDSSCDNESVQFVESIDLRWSCDEIREMVGRKIGCNRENIALAPWGRDFCTDNSRAGAFLMEQYDPRDGISPRVHFARFSFPLEELDRRTRFDVLLMDENFVTQNIVLFPLVDGTVDDTLQLIHPLFPFSENGTGQLRMVTINQQHRLVKLLDGGESMRVTFARRGVHYRVEEIPIDQLIIDGETELVLPVFHFDGDLNHSFSQPFYIKVVHNSLASEVRYDVQTILNVPKSEFEKYRVAYVVGPQVTYIDDLEENAIVNVAVIKRQKALGPNPLHIGLDHSDPDRVIPPSERSIVIRN